MHFALGTSKLFKAILPYFIKRNNYQHLGGDIADIFRDAIFAVVGRKCV